MLVSASEVSHSGRRHPHLDLEILLEFLPQKLWNFYGNEFDIMNRAWSQLKVNKTISKSIESHLMKCDSSTFQHDNSLNIPWKNLKKFRKIHKYLIILLNFFQNFKIISKAVIGVWKVPIRRFPAARISCQCHLKFNDFYIQIFRCKFRNFRQILLNTSTWTQHKSNVSKTIK